MLDDGLVDQERTSDSIEHVVTVRHFDACSLEDGLMPGYSVSSVNYRFAAQPRMMRIWVSKSSALRENLRTIGP
jgi:hypothetical protein